MHTILSDPAVVLPADAVYTPLGRRASAQSDQWLDFDYLSSTVLSVNHKTLMTKKPPKTFAFGAIRIQRRRRTGNLDSASQRATTNGVRRVVLVAVVDYSTRLPVPACLLASRTMASRLASRALLSRVQLYSRVLLRAYYAAKVSRSWQFCGNE